MNRHSGRLVGAEFSFAISDAERNNGSAQFRRVDKACIREGTNPRGIGPNMGFRIDDDAMPFCNMITNRIDESFVFFRGFWNWQAANHLNQGADAFDGHRITVGDNVASFASAQIALDQPSVGDLGVVPIIEGSFVTDFSEVLLPLDTDPVANFPH